MVTIVFVFFFFRTGEAGHLTHIDINFWRFGDRGGCVEKCVLLRIKIAS